MVVTDYSPYERHEMPNGSEVFYHDGRHSYFAYVVEKKGKWVGPNDARLPSPSAVGSVLDLDKAQRLMAWAARHPDAIGYRDKRAEEGSRVHKLMFEALAAGEGVPSLASVSEEERGRSQGVLAWWRDRKPEPIGSELVVYSKSHSYAGRLDLLCTLDGKRTVVDLKTSKFIGEGMHAQLAGYVAAADECGYGPIADSLILQVKPDGTYAEYPCVATASDFHAALIAYRVGKNVKKLATAQAKELAEREGEKVAA